MDENIRNRVLEMQKSFEEDELRLSMADPISKMLLVALAHQTNEIDRKIEGSISRLSEKFCLQVLQSCGTRALPSISVASIGNGKEYTPYIVDASTQFSLKSAKCNFRPLIKTRIIPGNLVCDYCNGVLRIVGRELIHVDQPNAQYPDEVWIAYDAAAEPDTFEDLTIALDHPLSSDMEMIAEAGGHNYVLRPLMDEEMFILKQDFMLTEYWKQHLVYNNLWMYRFCKTDSNPTPFVKTYMPTWMNSMFSTDQLASISAKRYVWIRIRSKSGCGIRSSSHILFNIVPIANYDVAMVKLSYTEPIKPLENIKQGSQFLEVEIDAEQANRYFIRDFDVNQYDNSRMNDDITNLYRHFVDDYFAFVDVNGLNDGAALRDLRSAMISVRDAMPAGGYAGRKPLNGVYAIRIPNAGNEALVVTYIVTNGEKGNILKKGHEMACSLTGTGKVVALCGAAGGRNKVVGQTAQTELARYEASSGGRLFTKVDLMNYCRLELIRALGSDVMHFCKISVKESIVPIENHIEKCLNVTYSFVSERHFNKAEEINFVEYMKINVEIRKSFNYNVYLKMELV